MSPGPADATDFYRDARRDLAGPLEGTRVLDVTTAWAGPLATCLLADLGADVVRVEMPGNRDGLLPPKIPGTQLSWFRETVHRNKRSVALDLRTGPARDQLRALVSTADVVVENFLPGTMAGWGLGYDDCRALKPDLVYVSISGWGQFGPRSRRPGYDPLAQAASGWMSLNGEPASGPVKAPTFLADDLAGLHAALGALAALVHRDRTGEGQHVDVALLDALLAQSNGLLTLAAAGVPLPRNGNAMATLVPCDAYGCQDGSVYVAVALDRHWRALAAAIGRPDLARAPGFATNAERVANRDQVESVVAGWCGDRGTDDVVDTLEAHGVAATRVNTFHEAAADPHVRARGMLQETRLSDGSSAPLTGPAAKFSRTPTQVRTAAPSPGADSDALLAELDPS